MTPDKLDPAEHLQIAINDILADAYQRGKQEGRGQMYEILVTIINAMDEKSRNDAIERA